MKFNVYDFAIALTHFLFTNVDVIKNYSDKQLSESFYEDAYTAVRKKFKKLDELLPDFYKRVYYRNDYMEIINELIMNETFSLTPANKFIISYNYCRYIFAVWGKPKSVSDKNIDDRAMYILQGLFRVYCEGNQVFDDKAYLYIRRDVYNRIYTLISVSRIPIPQNRKRLMFPLSKC